MNCVKTGIAWILILQIALPTASLSAFASSPPHADARGFRALFNQASKEPLIEALEKIPANDPLLTQPITLDPKDPAIDQDPFFMRSQAWEKSSARTLEAEVAETGFSIDLPAAGKTWRVEQPLHPVLTTDDYFFFAANEGSGLFDRKRGAQDELNVEGLFFVSYVELLQAATHEAPAPVYFMPLPGDTWEGAVEAFEFPRQNMLVLVDNVGDTLPVFRRDLEQLKDAESLNLMMAVGRMTESFARDMKAGKALDPSLKLKPARGSTAGFGTLFTGYDSDRPGKSSLDVSNTSLLNKLPWWSKALDLVVPSAHADVDANTAALIGRLMRVGTVCAFSLVASFLIRHTVYKEYFRKKNEERRKDGSMREIFLQAKEVAALHDARAEKDFLQKLKRHKAWVTARIQRDWNQTKNSRFAHEVINTGDVLAHVFTSFYQFPTVTMANGLEFLGDRFLPKYMAGKTTWVRRFLSATLYFSRAANTKLPVSTWTMFMGAFILGGIDTFFVAMQLYYVVPGMAQGLASAVPALKPKVDEAYDLNNPNLSTLNQNETVRNAASYITSGASSLSSDLRTQLLDKINPVIDQEMRNRGLDPSDPANKSDRDSRVKQRMNQELKARGLPGDDEFLFDMSTLQEKIFRLMGYEMPENLRGKDAFLGLERPGLIIASVREAVKRSRQEVAANPNDVTAAEKNAILEETSRRMNLLQGFASNPANALEVKTGTWDKIASKSKDYVRNVTLARQEIMALTYEGDDSEAIRNIPESWQGRYSEQATEAAAIEVRKAFLDLMEGDPIPDSRHAHPFREGWMADKQSAKAAAEADQRYFETTRERFDRAKQSSSYLLWKKFYSQSLRTREGAVAQWQIRKATRLAAEKYLEQTGQVFEFGNHGGESSLKLWNSLFSEALMNTVDIYPQALKLENDGLMRKVEAQAERATRTLISTDPKLLKFFESLPAEEAEYWKALMYAENMISQYVEVTSTSGEISLLSPSQPGRFQKDRQVEAVAQSKFRTQLHRFAEATFRNDAPKLGLASLLDRNVPMFYDFWYANYRVARSLLTQSTAIYGFNLVVWGFGLPLPLYVLGKLCAFAVIAPGQYLQRLFMQLGIKQMGSPLGMAVYATIYSWATFFGMLPNQLFANDFVDGWEHTQKTIGDAVTDVKNRCDDLLTNPPGLDNHSKI